MIKVPAYWMDPTGKIIPVPLKHINLISDNPKKFGLTKDYIADLYKKHNERPGQEGKAREEIMVGLMQKGWIRLRHHPKTEWMIQLDRLDNRRKDYLFLITTTVLERGVTFADIDCVVLHADHQVFSKETLIQISGRVGRQLEYAQGNVILYSEYVSSKMKRAKQEIQLMNRRNNET